MERGYDMQERLKRISIGMKGTMRDAMFAIDRDAGEICLVVDDAGRLKGTLTDGDIRRAFLAGAGLKRRASDYMQKKFFSVTAKIGRENVLDLMKARGLQQIPILDDDGVLVGLHLLREIIGAVPRRNWAVIMAGGKGERLRPLTESIPKPMILVAGRPILEHIVLHLVGYGIGMIFISIHYLGEVIERHFGDGSGFGCRIEYLRESKPLGTGGSLSLLPEVPSHPLLVLNGDLVTQFDLGNMLEYHSVGGFEVTVGVHDYVHKIPYGVVEIEGDRIVNVLEKPMNVWTTNAGIYVLEPALLGRVPRESEFPLPALIEDCLNRGTPVGAFRIQSDWVDVGMQKELEKARGDFQIT
jgi:dTDP-glucose pyrophosphorylase